MSWVERARHAAASKVLELVHDNYVVGLGSGTTVAYVVDELSRLLRSRKLNISVIPTSYQIELIAIKNSLSLTDLNQNPSPDLAIDGADQVDPNSLNVIKGGGAALAREKIVDSSAGKLAIVVDEAKLGRLGVNQPVPVEILPFGYWSTTRKISSLGGEAVLRESKGKVGPVVTDNGNLIVDVSFSRIDDPNQLEAKLKAIPGVVETGFFIEMVDFVYVGKRDGSVEVLERKRKSRR